MNAVAEPVEQAAAESPAKVITPQPGPQTDFISCDADIAIIGGGAFGGKTFSLLLLDVEHIRDGNFASVTFRRDTNQIRNPGGLWDEACGLYGMLGAKPLGGPLEQVFPSGAVSKFWHLEHPNDVYAWDGAQIPLLKFDQLESFEESQFWYMLSRNRDPSGHIKPYCRATCNPNPDSWLKRLLSWWIDEAAGYAIPERSGVIRWFLRIGEDIIWSDTREQLMDQFRIPELPDDHPKQPRPMSLTFIVARIWDNKIGLDKDPGYLAKLMNMPRHERERLLGDEQLGGNWNVRASAGMLFQRGWCPTLPSEPADVEWVRGWDLAATKPSSQSPDPDWTVGVKLGKYKHTNRFVISKAARDRLAPAGVEQLVKNTAQADTPIVQIRLPQDPGQAGKAQAKAYVGMLAGFSVKTGVVTGDKVTRFSPFSAQAQVGNVDLVEGLPEEFLRSLEAFPDAKHDDDADAVSTAFEKFIAYISGQNILDFYRGQSAEQKAAKAALKAPIVAPAAPAVAEPPQRPPQQERTYRSFAEALAAGCVPEAPQRNQRVAPSFLPDPERANSVIQRFDIRGQRNADK